MAYNLFMLIEQTHSQKEMGIVRGWGWRWERASAFHTKRANNNTIYANDQRHDAAPLL